jgi:hypothetical protein
LTNYWFLSREGTFYVRDFTSWSRDLRVAADGEGVVAMAGAVGLRMLADRTGLTAALSKALTRLGFQPVYDRGRVLADVATAIGCGATDIVDVEALRAQEQLFGQVASDTTAGRALAEVGQAGRGQLAAARARVREQVWALLPDGPPPLTIAATHEMGDQIVLRVDASIVECHSHKELAAGTYKKTFGHMPIGCWIDNTGELASLLLRPGNAAPNNALDLVTVVDEAIAQVVPPPWRGHLLVTSDTAGASHELIGWLSELNTADNGMRVEYSIGWDIDAMVRTAIGMLHPESWVPALDPVTGAPRDDMDIAEITAEPHLWTVDEIRRVLAVIDRQSATGKRDYAMILATARLGLRISDLRHLELGDLDWRAKQITIVQHKTGRPLSLPLLEDVGWAIIDYVRGGRPETACPMVFVKHRHPFDAFGSASSVASRLSRHAARAGIEFGPGQVCGMHSLRGALAVAMIGNGASMPVVSAVLGHASSDTTQAYYLQTPRPNAKRSKMPTSHSPQVSCPTGPRTPP